MPAATSDLNLLFGMMALQLDFINKEQLITGMQAWVNCKTKSLGRTLVEQGVLAPDRHQLLNTLVKKHLETHGNDPQQSLAALNVNVAARDALKPIRDADLHASLVRMPNLRVPQPPAPPAASPGGGGAQQYATIAPTAGSKENTSRFRILRPHAKGGLGVVFVARDEEIGREVALKEIQIQFTRDADSRARFVLEAEITGGLEHPGIVPVYGLGHYPDGRPYYAMRFIRGDSLKEAVDRFHAQDMLPGRDAHERLLSFRQLLRRFVDVCDAMEYAHSKGVLHRDLKPGNIMLGKFGETLVVDWGLAKAMGKTESPSMASIHLNEAPLTPSIRNDSAQTQMGSAIGTPAFMSPEQAAGRLDLLGPASDVYSLGATLYYVLTGQPSMMSSDLAEVLNNVQKGVFPKPREIKPKIRRPLEAICLKAMALEVPDRYQSAFELKTDLDHYLDDLPVSAWPEPLVVRARRWLNRNRALATSTVAGVLVAAISLGVATLLLTAKNDELKNLNGSLETANGQLETANGKLATANTSLEAATALAQANEIEAKKQTIVAKEQTAEVERQKLISDWRVYSGNIALALAAWNGSEGAAKAELTDKYLGECAPEFRGWEYRYVYTLRNKAQTTLEGHTDGITSVAFSGDSQRVVSGSIDSKVKIWDVKSRKESVKLTGHKGHSRAVNGVAFSIDGSRIVSGSADGKAIVWDANSGQFVHELAGNYGAVTSVAISADGNFVVCGHSSGKVRRSDIKTGKEVNAFIAYKFAVTSVAFSPDGQRIISNCNSGQERPIVWDATTGKEQFRLIRPGKLIGPDSAIEGAWCAIFSRDGQKIVTGDIDGNVRIWDATDGGKLLKSLPGHTDYVSSVAMSADGKRIVSGSDDTTLKIWDADTGHEILTLKGHKRGITSVAISADGQSIVSGGGTQYDKHVKIWDASLSQTTTTLKGHTKAVNSVGFGAKGGRIVSGGQDGALKVTDSATGKETFDLKGHAAPVRCAATDLNDKYIVSGGDDKAIKVWDGTTGAIIRTLKGHKLSVAAVAISMDGEEIVSGSYDKTVKLWNKSTGLELQTFSGHENYVLCVAISPNGQRIVSGSLDKKVKIWDKKGGPALLTLAEHTSQVLSVAFSRDGKLFLSGSDDKTIKVWDAATGQCLRTLVGHTGPVNCVAFSPDGNRIVSGSDDKTVKMWDAKGGQDVLTLKEHAGPVLSVAFSPDGLQIVSGSEDATIKIWDATTSPPAVANGKG